MGQVTQTTLIAGTVVNADIAAGAGIEASKLIHQSSPWTTFGFSPTGTPTTTSRTLFVARSSCVIRDVIAMLVADGSSTSIAFDLQKNGVSVLSAAITITNTTGDNTPVAGTLITTALSSGDILTAVMTVTSSTGATGPFMQVRVQENPV